MSRQEILNQLIVIFQRSMEETGDQLGTITENTDLRTDLGMNSIGMICMAILIEESFQIQFGDIGLGSLRTVADVIDYIEKLREAR